MWPALLALSICSIGTVVTAGQTQECELTFHTFGSQQDRVVFTGLTAEEGARSDSATTGHKLTCDCVNVTGLTPLQWLDWNQTLLPDNDTTQLVDYRAANRQTGSAVNLRINQAGFSCAEAGEYTCVVGTNNRTVLVTPIGVECGPANVTVTASPTGPVSIGTDLTMECSAEDPTGSGLTYQWLKKGTLISGELSPTLMVIGTGPQEGGSYTCRVRNRVGQGEASFTVEVIEDRPASSMPAEVTSTTAEVTPMTVTGTPAEVTAMTVTSAPAEVTSMTVTSTPAEMTAMAVTSAPAEVTQTEVTSISGEKTSIVMDVTTPVEMTSKPIEVTSVLTEQTSTTAEAEGTVASSPVEGSATMDDALSTTAVSTAVSTTPTPTTAFLTSSMEFDASTMDLSLPVTTSSRVLATSDLLLPPTSRITRMPGTSLLAVDSSTPGGTTATPVVPASTPFVTPNITIYSSVFVVTSSIPDIASSTPLSTSTIPELISSTPLVTPNTQIVASSTPVITPSTPDIAAFTPVITSTPPVADSTSAVVTPSSTTITSTHPVTDSTSAVVTPSSTTITSTPPVADSTSAVVTPSSTTITSTPPVADSTSAAVTPSSTTITSTPQVADSTSAAVTPSSTITSTPPVADSTSAAMTPSSTTITSTPPVADSTSAVVTPSSTTASARPSTSPTPSPPVDPQTPTDVSVSTPRVTDNAVQITLMWSEPGNNSGLTGYQIQYSWESKWDPSRFVKRQSERKTMSVSVNVTDTSYTLQDAEGFAEYCFAVSALYEGGEESNATAKQCTTTLETKPFPPLHLRQVGSSVTTSSVRLQWDAPDRPNGNITHFKVYYQQGSSRQYQVSDWHSQGYVVLDGLDPDTEYYVNVTAVTDTLESDASNGLRVVTQVTRSDEKSMIWIVAVVMVALVLVAIIVLIVGVRLFILVNRCCNGKAHANFSIEMEEKGLVKKAKEIAD